MFYLLRLQGNFGLFFFIYCVSIGIAVSECVASSTLHAAWLLPRSATSRRARLLARQC